MCVLAPTSNQGNGQATCCYWDRSFEANYYFGCIYWIKNSWAEVDVSTIQKCFAKCGFGISEDMNENSDHCHSDNVDDDENDEDDDLPLAAMKLARELFVTFAR